MTTVIFAGMIYISYNGVKSELDGSTPMPRMSREETAQTRAKIVAAAARLFRERGVAATGVADVMKAAGLTHGGFYRHFVSKDALMEEAISHAVCQSLEALERSQRDGARGQALFDYIDRYLSTEHIEQPGRGCPLAALGGEAPHVPADVAHRLGQGSERAIAAMAAAMDGDEERAAALMATLLGAVVLARMAAAQDSRDKILSAGRTAAIKLVKGEGRRRLASPRSGEKLPPSRGEPGPT